MDIIFIWLEYLKQYNCVQINFIRNIWYHMSENYYE